jgi:hypothetical protein
MTHDDDKPLSPAQARQKLQGLDDTVQRFLRGCRILRREFQEEALRKGLIP